MWFIMACQVKDDTRIVAVDAPGKNMAIIHAISEIRRIHSLPNSHTLIPQILHEVDTQEEAENFIERLSDKLKEIEEEGEIK